MNTAHKTPSGVIQHDPYLAADADYAANQDRQWERLIAIDSMADSIIRDDELLEEAVGDYCYGPNGRPDRYRQMIAKIAAANGDAELIAASRELQAELQLIAHKMAEDAIGG